MQLHLLKPIVTEFEPGLPEDARKDIAYFRGMIVILCVLHKTPSLKWANKMHMPTVVFNPETIDGAALPPYAQDLFATMLFTSTLNVFDLTTTALEHYKPDSEEGVAQKELAQQWLSESPRANIDWMFEPPPSFL